MNGNGTEWDVTDGNRRKQNGKYERVINLTELEKRGNWNENGTEGDANGTRARRDGKGTETGRERDGNGTGTGRERDGNGMGTGRERDGNGTGTGRERNGTRTGRNGVVLNGTGTRTGRARDERVRVKPRLRKQRLKNSDRKTATHSQ